MVLVVEEVVVGVHAPVRAQAALAPALEADVRRKYRLDDDLINTIVKPRGL